MGPFSRDWRACNGAVTIMNVDDGKAAAGRFWKDSLMCGKWRAQVAARERTETEKRPTTDEKNNEKSLTITMRRDGGFGCKLQHCGCCWNLININYIGWITGRRKSGLLPPGRQDCWLVVSICDAENVTGFPQRRSSFLLLFIPRHFGYMTMMTMIIIIILVIIIVITVVAF